MEQRQGSVSTEEAAPQRMGLTAGTEVGPPPRRRGARRHDGFYFRLAAGFSAYTEVLQSDDTEFYGGEVEARLRGFAVSSELAFGGTVSPGVVLGGGIYSDDVIVSMLDVRRGDGLPAEVDPPSRNLTLYAPFVDWYFNPNKGFHLQLAVGIAQLHGVDLTGVDWEDHVYHAYGIGIMLGLGHEWWISDEWSVGLLGRFSASALWGEDDADVDWLHAASAMPGFLLTLTYH